MPRHASVEVDLDAVTHNAGVLRAAAPGAELCAVVKADGYGHGAASAARAALAGGATWLAVALVEEGVALRDAGIAAPVLVLSEPDAGSMADAHAAGLTPMIYTPDGIAAAEAAAARRDDAPWSVHLKVDTGMHRVGCDPDDAVALAGRIATSDRLRLGGTATHLAVADEPRRPETGEQLDRFDAVLAGLDAAGTAAGVRHAANSAGALAHRRSHLDLVRCGIALFGVAPSEQLAGLPGAAGLRPAMAVRARVTLVKPVRSGEGVSYGLCHTFGRDAVVATVPVGYADGVRRALGLTGGEVLVGGVRRPIRGVVTMDQLVVEVTDGPPVRPGDDVVLLGSQGGEEVTAAEWARRLGTIPYEVLTGFGPRLPRHHHGTATP